MNQTLLFKKKLYLIVSLFFLGWNWSEAEDICGLDYLWDRLSLNPEILEAEMEEKIAARKLDYLWQQYIPSVTVSTTSSFSDLYKGFSEKPEEISSVINIAETFPNGLYVNVMPTIISCKNDLENERVWQNKRYSEVLKLSFSMNQKLCDYDLLKMNMNSQKQELLYENELKTLYKENLYVSEMKKITTDYILLRQINRNILLLEAKIEVLHKIIENMLLLQKRGEISQYEIYLQEDNLLEYENELFGLKKDREIQLINLLVNSCAFEEIDKKIFNYTEDAVLPEIKRIYKKDPQFEIIKTQKKLLENQLIQLKMNSSPILSLSGTIPLRNTSRNWTVTAVVDFGSLSSTNRKLIDQNYEDLLNQQEQKLIFARNRLIYENKQYFELMNNAKTQLDNLEQALQNEKKVLDFSKQSFEQGNISIIDLLKTELSYTEKYYTVENQKDLLWLYQWFFKNTME